MKTIDVALVCVYYDSKKLQPTLRALQRIDRAIGLGHTIRVANHEATWTALKSTSVAVDGAEVIRHDNSGMEFGAYQAGLDRLLADHDPEWVLFANDTFATHHSFGTVYRRKLAAETGRGHAVPAIIGQVVYLPRSFTVEGLRTYRWISTNLFALNREARRALDGRVYRDELNARITETSEMANFFRRRSTCSCASIWRLGCSAPVRVGTGMHLTR
jgi:hypothetical protein